MDERSHTSKDQPFRNPWILRIVCCGVLGIGVMGSPGYAATVGGQERPLITHGPIKGELELGIESLRNKQSGGTVNRASDSQIWKERLRFATEGDVYHSNLLAYSVMAEVGLSQSRFSSDGQTMNESDTLDEYNAVFQFLRMKPYPMTLLLNKSDDLISRPYQGPLQNERKSTGFSLSTRSLDLPMRFQYTVDESNQYSLANPSQDNYYRKDERFRYSVEHEFSKLSHLSYDYERNNITRKNADQQEVPTTENRHYLKHDITFGSNHEYKLDSSLNYFNKYREPIKRRTCSGKSIWKSSIPPVFGPTTKCDITPPNRRTSRTNPSTEMSDSSTSCTRV